MARRTQDDVQITRHVGKKEVHYEGVGLARAGSSGVVRLIVPADKSKKSLFIFIAWRRPASGADWRGRLTPAAARQYKFNLEQCEADRQEMLDLRDGIEMQDSVAAPAVEKPKTETVRPSATAEQSNQPPKSEPAHPPATQGQAGQTPKVEPARPQAAPEQSKQAPKSGQAQDAAAVREQILKQARERAAAAQADFDQLRGN